MLYFHCLPDRDQVTCNPFFCRILQFFISITTCAPGFLCWFIKSVEFCSFIDYVWKFCFISEVKTMYGFTCMSDSEAMETIDVKKTMQMQFTGLSIILYGIIHQCSFVIILRAETKKILRGVSWWHYERSIVTGIHDSKDYFRHWSYALRSFRIWCLVRAGSSPVILTEKNEIPFLCERRTGSHFCWFQISRSIWQVTG